MGLESSWKVRGGGVWARKVRGKFEGKGFESARKVRGVRDWVGGRGKCVESSRACGRGKCVESSGVV